MGYGGASGWLMSQKVDAVLWNTVCQNFILGPDASAFASQGKLKALKMMQEDRTFRKAFTTLWTSGNLRTNSRIHTSALQ